MKSVEVISLIYKSPAYADFIFDQLARYVDNFGDWRMGFRLVANDPTPELESHLKKIGVNHTIFRNENPNEYYINRVYKAWNHAVLTSPAEYVCLVNSDMAFSPNWLKNLAKHASPTAVLTSRLVESGKMPSGRHGVSRYFGNTPQSYDESAFLKHAELINWNVLKRDGGLYMPMLISKELFIRSKGYPPGNVYANGVGTCKGRVIQSGDAYYFEKLETHFGARHYTVFDSVVYHFQEGELDEKS